MRLLHPSYISSQFKSVTRLEKSLNKWSEEKWMKRGEAMALKLFHAMAKKVPAYKDFLHKNKINPVHVKTLKDFKQVPFINKDNYLRAYSLDQLCWDGDFSNKNWVISSTSGSTGEPFYFPRQEIQSLQYAKMAELYLRTNFQIHKKKTLYIVGFPMGVWIGGLFTYQALDLITKNGDYALSVITPGIHKEEIIKAVKVLGGKFDQILIGSYGPFLKDILDDGERAGVRWKDYNLGFIFSAEGFTEDFRDYVLKKAGLSRNFYLSSLNHYGTVDLGTMSYETPFAILIRRSAIANNVIYKNIFGNTIKLPTLTQYIPDLFYFEDVSGSLICSANSGLPLVRYDLKDHGGVLSFKDTMKTFQENNVDIMYEARKVGIENTVWQLPFVHIYERKDFSVSFYAFNIYPETIRRALQKKEMEPIVTGKFTMLVKFNINQDQVLEINIELKANVNKNKQIEKQIQEVIKHQLLQESSEYRETYIEKKDTALPNVVLWNYEDPTYFKPGVKQKWVKK